MIDILCQIRDNMAKSGITWPYKIEKGQIQKTSSSNQWYPVKFSFSSGDQWVNSAFHRFWKRFIIFSSAKRCNFFSKIWNGLAIAFTNKSKIFFIFPTLNNAAIILFSRYSSIWFFNLFYNNFQKKLIFRNGWQEIVGKQCICGRF